MKFWIARSEGGELSLHFKKPTYHKGYGWTSICSVLNSKEFPEIIFENSPQEVEFKLINNVSE
jgi:hypothetical protein